MDLERENERLVDGVGLSEALGEAEIVWEADGSLVGVFVRD